MGKGAKEAKGLRMRGKVVAVWGGGGANSSLRLGTKHWWAICQHAYASVTNTHE